MNTNQQTTGGFGDDETTLQEAVIACYNHIRMEGTYGRVGYNYDVCRGDEAWNSSQVWYLPFDELNSPITNDMNTWVYRDWFFTINACNFVLYKIPSSDGVSDEYKRMRGQALFIRGLAYYNLTGYYQNVPIITDYTSYSTLDGAYTSNNTQEEVIAQIKSDLTEALELLPTRDEGGEWACGRATKGAAAGFLVKTLMFNHEYAEALKYAKSIINGEYGSYDLMPNYGDNFREGTAYENNKEALFEVQFLDYGMQGTDDEWTPVNTSANATQGHAVESNFAAGAYGGWADISAANWLYNLFKEEKTTDGKLDPRMYWTIGTYETDWTESYPEGGRGNMYYGTQVTDTSIHLVTNSNNGGIPIVKWTNARTGIIDAVVTGLKCGINLRIIRLADIYLLAAEAANEEGDIATAITYINKVRSRANLKELSASDFDTETLFEQIANVERPKELGCEFGRGFDLIRWGWFYDSGRLAQLKDHAAIKLSKTINTDKLTAATADKTSYDNYRPGHEYIPYYQGTLNDNPNIGEGNSANTDTPNTPTFKVHSVPSK